MGIVLTKSFITLAAIESAGIRVINLVVNVQFSHLKPFLLPPGHRYFSKLDTLLSIIIKLDDGAGASTQFWETTMGKKYKKSAQKGKI